MGKPKAPAAPDYAAAATAQGTANVDAAQATNYLNQANQVTPYGNLNYSYSNPDSGQGQYTSSGTYIPQTTVTQTLSPGEQKLYDQTNQISTALNDQAIKGIGYVDQATSSPLTAGQFGQVQTGAGVNPNFTNGVPTSNYQTGVPTSQFQDLQGAGQGIQTSVNGGADPAALKQAQDAVYQQLTSRLDPQFEQQQSALDAKLANQGIFQGSEAYNTAVDNFGRTRNDAYNQAGLSSVAAGNGLQNQLFGQGLASGQFANAAQQQGFSQGQAANTVANTNAQNLFSQNAQNLGFYNTAQDSQFQQALQNAQMGNQNQQQLFQNGLANAQLNNQAIGQQISQADYFKNQPLNMLNALRSGNQVTNPNFVNNTNTQIGAAPVYQATADQGAADQAAYAQKMAGYTAMLNGLGKLGGAAVGKWG